MGNIRAIYTGTVLLDTVRFGTLDSLPNVVVAFFRLKADLQSFPIYTRGVAAIALRRYYQVVTEKKGLDGELVVTVEMDLLAKESDVMLFAAKIHWHVYGELRSGAEARITTDKRYLFGGVGLPQDWPRETLTIRARQGGVAGCTPFHPGQTP
jgi:hypothetical protein